MEETIALIKSCLISKKGGIPIKSLNHEFEKIVGEPIPYTRLGFPSLQSLLTKVDGLKTIKKLDGEETLIVNDPKIKHIVDLIKKQKEDYKGTNSKYYKRFAHYPSSYYNNINRNHDNTSKDDQYEDRNKVWFNDNIKYYKRRNGNQTFNQTSNLESTKNNKCLSYEVYDNEHNNIIVIEKCTSIIERTVYEPIILRHQLIGDDFFLQLVIRNLGLPVWRQRGDMALRCGLCISGQTINDCVKKLNDVECISNQIVIMLGAVDIYNGASFDDLIKNMEYLLKILRYKFAFSNSAIKICTIPPLANLSLHGHVDKARALYSFNNWIRGLNHEADSNSENCVKQNSYRIIDFFEGFTDETYTTQYEWFQLNARMVSGCKHPYVLWNKYGRKRAMEILTGEL
ncbi:hypothetical protein HZH68_007037 [Vespula germanica]|uniref:HTH OST-type domain-containing protein n=1 Tax=Vespula germanica TaxID=30212 RepID=A0A834K8B3_VESGE|nr:hypothetical protein HZH68_007037 [Vespula germanica]